MTQEVQHLYSTASRICCHSRTAHHRRPEFSLGHSPNSHSRTLVSTPGIHVNTRITTHLLSPEKWKAELVQLAAPQWIVYPQRDHLSTTDRAQGRESVPTKDRYLTTELQHQVSLLQLILDGRNYSCKVQSAIQS